MIDPKEPKVAYDQEFIKFPEEQVKELLKKATEKYENWKSQRTGIEYLYVLAHAMYVGRQHVTYDTGSKRVMFSNGADDVRQKPRIVINRILSKVRAGVARIVRSIPTAEVIPNTTDSSDLNGARCANAILKLDYQKQKKRNVYERFADSMTIYGHAWLKDVWDTMGGEQTTTKRKEVDEQGVENEVVDVEYKGAPLTTVVDPLQMYYDLNVREWDDVWDCVQEDYMSIDYIRENIPNSDNVQPEGREGVTSVNAFVYDGNSASDPSGAYVREYWSKKNRFFPEGVRMVWIQNEVRICEPLYCHEGQKLPYSHARYINVPGCIRGVGIPELLFYIQQVLNKTSSQVIDNAELMLNIKVLKSKGTQLDSMTDAVGEILDYAGIKPEFWQPGPLPSTHFELLRMIDKYFDDVSMIHITSEGGVSPSINSGDQADVAIENGSMTMNPIANHLYEAVACSCKNIIEYYQKYCPDEIIARIVGEGKKFEILKFKGLDIKGNTDVYIAEASVANQSRSARTNEIRSILQSNFMADMSPEKREVMYDLVFKYLKTGENDKIISDIDADVNRAERENQAMESGGDAFVMPFDDQDKHIFVHETFIKSAEFESLNDEAKGKIIAHWQDHVDKKNLATEPPPPPPMGGMPQEQPMVGQENIEVNENEQ